MTIPITPIIIIICNVTLIFILIIMVVIKTNMSVRNLLNDTHYIIVYLVFNVDYFIVVNYLWEEYEATISILEKLPLSFVAKICSLSSLPVAQTATHRIGGHLQK